MIIILENKDGFQKVMRMANPQTVIKIAPAARECMYVEDYDYHEVTPCTEYILYRQIDENIAIFKERI